MADPIDTGEKTVTGRTIWRDPETGEDYSERSTTFEIDGKYYTMPTVDKNGNQYSDDTIREYVKENGPIDFITGEELPEFRYREDAIEYAISRSDTRKQKEEPMLEEQMEMFNEGGLRDEGGSIDPESGNDVPIGSMKEEVRDDVPAMLSEGEFVLPADVVRYIGLENLMRLRQDAKMGLKQMEAMGQMGNSEEATMPDDLPFGPSDLIIMSGEPQEMNQGGMATGIGGYQPSVFQNQPQTTAPAIPPSSVTPPTPAPSPAGGYMPKFMGNQTAATDNSLVVNNPSTGTTNTGTATNTSTTEEKKFVPTVEDVYTTIKYINKETGEIRDFYFYQGNPVTPIPEGFVPYTETSDAEVTTGTESTATEDTSVRTGGGGNGSINIPQPEKIDWSTYSAEELQDAFDKNRKTRMALTAMGAINPLIALFGQGATRMQEKEILAAMKEKGIEPPEVEGGLFSKIGSFIGGLFGQEKEEQAAVAASSVAGIDTTVRPKLRPQIMSDEERRLIAGMDAVAGAGAKVAPPVTDEESILMRDMSSVARAGVKRPAADNLAELRRKIEKDRGFSRFERDLAINSARATRDAGLDLALYGRGYSDMGRTLDLIAGKTSPDRLDPRGTDQRGQTAEQREDSIEAARKKASDDAAAERRKDRRRKKRKQHRENIKAAGRKAQKDVSKYKSSKAGKKATSTKSGKAAMKRTESVVRDMQRGIKRGFAKGGLASRTN